MSVATDEPQNETQKSVSERLLWQIEKLNPKLEALPVQEHAGVIAILQLLGTAPKVVRDRVLTSVEALAEKLEKMSEEDCQALLGLLAAFCKARSIDEQRHQAAQRALAIR